MNLVYGKSKTKIIIQIIEKRFKSLKNLKLALFLDLYTFKNPCKFLPLRQLKNLNIKPKNKILWRLILI